MRRGPAARTPRARWEGRCECEFARRGRFSRPAGLSCRPNGAGSSALLVELQSRLTLEPVLARLSDLRRGYMVARKGDFTSCNESHRRLVGLLRDPDVAGILDPLLDEAARTRRSTPETLEDFRAIEETLGSFFGLSPREVRKRTRLARSSPYDPTPIGSTVDLTDQIRDLHTHTKERIAAGRAAGWKGWKGRSAIKKAIDDAERVLFATGTIVADGTFSSAFGSSYSIGTAALSREEAV